MFTDGEVKFGVGCMLAGMMFVMGAMTGAGVRYEFTKAELIRRGLMKYHDSTGMAVWTDKAGGDKFETIKKP